MANVLYGLNNTHKINLENMIQHTVSVKKGIKNFKDLPVNAKNYVSELGKFIETKISSISTSPERNDTILIEDPFNN